MPPFPAFAEEPLRLGEIFLAARFSFAGNEDVYQEIFN
jgi:hypothetical protein